MIEDYEGILSPTLQSNKNMELSKDGVEYIKECITPPRPDVLALRIDELQKSEPPKALDSNPQIAELIEPIKNNIPSFYMEAPTDMEQVEQISDILASTEGIRIEEWKELSLNDREKLLNKIERQIAEIEHRHPCPIEIKNLGKISETNGMLLGHMGVHETSVWGEKIVINSELVKSNHPLFYKEVLDTVLHEGRHSYQTYNLKHRETHTSKGDLTNWRVNFNKFGYQNAELCGFKAYWMQPIEADARKFAEDVLTAYKRKI